MKAVKPTVVKLTIGLVAGSLALADYVPGANITLGIGMLLLSIIGAIEFSAHYAKTIKNSL